MAAPANAFQETVSFSELKKLARAPAPCVTIALPLPNPLEIHSRLNHAVHDVERRLSATERDRATAELLDPIRAAAAAIEAKGSWAKAMLALRSSGLFQVYWLRNWGVEIVDVRDRFQLRPLFAAMAREQQFYLLGLSERHLWLFQCTMFRAEEVRLPPKVPRNLREWVNQRQPDHVLDNRAVAGPSTGSMKGVLFGTSRDREKHDEYLGHFFREVDEGVRAVIRDHTAALVLAGVERDLAVYRRINMYPRLFDKHVYGSPDGIAAPELVERARDIVSQSLSEAVRKVIANMNRQPVTADPREIPAMASEGRIADLLILENTEQDQLDLATTEVIRHGGRVFAVRPAEMPRNASAVAVLRH